ncbi:MAG: hypothetical protein ABIE42_06260 [Candidatus Eisenbacteria bacterium]
MRLAILLLLVWAGVAVAVPVNQVASPMMPKYEWQPMNGVMPVWTQELMDDGGWALASQYAADYPFYAETADDFSLSDGRPVVAVEWWGAYWNPGAPPYAANFVVRFYESDPGNKFAQPGALLYEHECAAYVEELLPEQTWWYRYYCDLAEPFAQVPGETYWVSIQAMYPWYEGGQWGWGECVAEDYWSDEAVYVFDALGVPAWAPISTSDPYVHRECAFVLYVDNFNPVEPASWSVVKAMFR